MDAETGRLILAALLSFAGGAILTLWLDRVRGARSTASRLRSLRREIDENLVRIGPLDGTARGGFPRPIARTAWEAARDVVSETTFAVIADAYAEGAELNNRIEIVDRNLTAAGGAIDASTNAGQQAIRHQRALSESAIRAGEVARAAFEKARDEMRKP